MKTNIVVKSLFAKWLKQLNNLPQDAELFGDEKYSYEVGKKYVKVTYDLGGYKSVFAFMDADGNIYKPDGWKKPAKGVRATIFDEHLPLECGQLYCHR